MEGKPESARTPQVLGPDVWDSPITCKLELPCLTDCLIDMVFYFPIYCCEHSMQMCHVCFKAPTFLSPGAQGSPSSLRIKIA